MSKKKTIVSVVGTRGFPDIQGGVEKQCESIYPLMNDEWEFIVYRRRPYVNSNKTYPRIHFVDLPSTKIKGFEALFHSFIATIACCLSSASIVHFHNIGPGLFSPIVRLFGKKVVLTYHSANYEHAKWGKIAQWLLKFSEKISLYSSNAVIFVNYFQMGKYPQNIKRKSFYIPNGVPQVTPTKANIYIEFLGLKPKNYILSVGRITPEKGFDILIKAFEKTKTNYKLVIVGGIETESEYFKELKSIVQSDRIVFTGFIHGEKLNEIYSHAALYVLSSRNEGFPLVLLEAMKYKIDVLASDIPASRLVKLKETDYFKMGDIDDLATKLIQKLKHLESRNYDLSIYDWHTIAQQIEKVYRITKS